MTLVSDRAVLRRWGDEALATIRQDFDLPNSALLGEERTLAEVPTQPAFNWSAGVMLSALAAAGRIDPQKRPWLREYADALQGYWNPKPPVPGFDVLPGPKEVDRYYDDNAWMVMALVETFEVLGDRKYLDQAEAALKYVFSGETNQLGGGILWRESDRASKNTCSNGPAAAAALAVYRHNKAAEWLQAAKRIYGWTRANLQDPVDGLYWDNLGVVDRKLDRTKWTYNSGLMLRTARELYEITKEPEYKRDAERITQESINRWAKDEGRKGIADEGKFAHLLVENWLPEAHEARSRALQYLYEKVRDPRGRYGNRWDELSPPPKSKWALIDQASAARAFFRAAND